MKDNQIQVAIDKALKDENTRLKAIIASWKNIIEPMIVSGQYDGTILHYRLETDFNDGDLLLHELDKLRDENVWLKSELVKMQQKLKGK